MATPMDGNPEPAGAPEQPTSATSQGQGQLSKADIQVILDRLDNQEKFMKGLQKGTDKQIGAVRDDVKRILELKEQGLNATQIERELWIDQQMSAPAPSDPGKSQGAGFDVNKVVDELKLDGNNPLVAAYKVAYKDDLKGLLEKLTALSQPAKAPAPASAPLPESGSPPTGGLTPMEAQTKLATLNSYYKQPTRYVKEIAALEKELEPYMK